MRTVNFIFEINNFSQQIPIHWISNRKTGWLPNCLAVLDKKEMLLLLFLKTTLPNAIHILAVKMEGN